jgi:excinuclease UvrABC nuclease subunit
VTLAALPCGDYALGDALGVGPQRARALLERFGSIAAVAAADVTALASVPNIGYSAARAIRDAIGAEPTTTRVSVA